MSPKVSLMPLDDSIERSKDCIDMLIDNRFMDAVEFSARYADRSVYHSHCHSLLLFIKAYLSLEMVSAPNELKVELTLLLLPASAARNQKGTRGIGKDHPTVRVDSAANLSR